MSKSTRFIKQTQTNKLNTKDKNIEEKDTWELVHAFFEHHGQVQHQLDSYNDFIENGIPQVFENNRILTVTCKDKTYKVEFGECVLTNPTHGELNGNITNITPMECINRDITYEAELLVDIETTDFNGHVNRYPKEIIGQIPVMVRSNLCNLRDIIHDKEELAKLKEDFYDPGGDFIINGGRKVVTSQERTAQNAVYVFANKKTAPKFTLFAQVRSGSLTGSHSTTTEVGIMKDGLISVTLPYIELTSIPLGVLYRALGVVGDIKNIVPYILPDFQDKEALAVLIKSLEHSLEISSQDQALLFIGKKGVKFTRPQKYRIEEPEKETKDSKKKNDLKRKIKLAYDEFSGEKKKTMTHEALLWNVIENSGFDSKPYKIAKEVAKEDEKTKSILIKILKEKMNWLDEIDDRNLKELIDVDDETKQAISYARHLLTAELFPHLESTESNFIKKRFYLGYMTFKLLQVVLKRSTLQDRDHFANKRVATSGVLLRQQFEGSFRRMKNEIENSIERSIRGGSSTIKVTSYINPKTITNAMRGALSDNSWGARGKNQGVSQKTDQFNFISALSNLRKVVTPISQEGGKIDAPRKLHSSQWGITCLAETPEGKKCLTLDTRIKTKYGERELGNLKNGDIVFTWDIESKSLVQSEIKDYFTDEREVFKVVCSYNYDREFEKTLVKKPTMIRSKREKLTETQKTYIKNSELEHFSIEATKDHPFLTKDGWKELGDLNPGDKVYIFKIKDYYPISSIISQGVKTVADFTTVSDNHNFIANEFVTHNCGLIKNLALGSYITIGSDPRPILEYFQTMDIIKFEEYNNTNENLLRLAKIFVNGSPLGVTKYPEDFVRETRMLRRGNLNPETSISYNKFDNEIKISTEAGRLCRPLLIVENGKILLKKSHIQEIREGKWNYPSVWQNLLEGGFVEFIDKSEEEDLLIALSPSEFQQKNSKIYKYTHCELNSSLIFGVGASLIPYPDHNQCIHEEEPVLMADGSCKKIKDVVVGDEVFTFHPETQEKSITKVVQTYNGPTDKTMFEITTLSGRKIKATYDHRFMTSEGWKQLGNIDGETYIAVSLDPIPIFRKKTHKTLCVDKQAMEDSLWKTRGMNEHKFAKFELESIYSNSPKIGIIARLYGYFMSGAEPNKEVNDECKMCFGQPFKECIPCFESFADDKLPKWLMSGQEFIKREFLAGYKGGALGGICYENNIAYEKVKVSFRTAKYIRKYYQDVLELYKSFGFQLLNVLPSKPPELKGRKAYKKTHLVSATAWKTEHSFIIAEKQMEESVSLIGYRYDKTKMTRAGVVIEYLKTRSYLRSSLKTLDDQKKIRKRMYESFEDWEKDIKIVDTTLFVPVMFVKKIPTKNIADITTESENHSFLSGDCFCVHNSPRNTYQCIWKEEQVLMGDGNWKKIKNIEVGDKVISFDPVTMRKKRTEVIHHHVSPTDKKMVKLTTLSNRSIVVTEDHKIITPDGWVEAGKLIPMQSKVGISLDPVLEPHNHEKFLVVSEESFLEKMNKWNIKKSLTQHYLQELREKRFIPLYSDHPKLYILARFFGFLMTDGSIGVYNQIPRIQLDFGSETSGIDFERDMENLGYRKCKLLYGEREFKGSIYHTWKVNHQTSCVALILSLGMAPGKKTNQETPGLPLWILKGPYNVKREFIAAFQGGDGCQMRWNKMNKKGHNFVCGDTLLTRYTEFIKSARKFFEQMVYILKEFDIQAKVITGKSKNIGRSCIGYRIQCTQENLVKYFQTIGYRYCDLKTRNSGLSVEYAMYKNELKKIYTDKVKITRQELENYKSPAYVARKLNLDYSFVSSIHRSNKKGRQSTMRNLKPCEYPKEWIEKNITGINEIIFVTLKSIEEVPNVEIADITTKSKNHSFIAGQGFCVHNSAMGKQAIGIPGSNFLYKTKGTFFAMDYPQKPLIASKTSRLIGFDDLPAGQNVVVSVCPWKGFNQEDSIIMNQDSIDRGFMNITAFMCYEAKLDRPGEKFEIPIESETNRFKGNTSKLELESIGNFGGNIYGTQRETEKHEHIFCYVPKGRKVEEGDTLIGKIISEDITGMTLNRKNKTDESVVYDQPWPGTIHAVHRGINGAGYPYIRIVVAQKRPPVFGDKFSARHG